MSNITWADFSAAVTTITASIMNEIKSAVNSKSDSTHTHDDYLDTLVDSQLDHSWSGQTMLVTAGESLSAADFSKAYYIKNYSSTSRAYKFQAGAAFSDNDTYPPIGIVLDDDTYDLDAGIAATGTALVTIGRGVLRDDSLSLIASDRGKRLYIAEAGGWTTTRPSATGSWSYPAGIILSISPTLVYFRLPLYGTRNS